MNLASFIDTRSSQIEKLEKAHNQAWWNLAVTGQERYARELEQAKINLRTLYSSKEDLQFLLSTPVPIQPHLKRQQTLLLNQYREHQIPQELMTQITALETEVEATYTQFRAVVRGQPLSNNDLKKILIESLDSKERREAWEASKLIGEAVESRVLQLIELRNQGARAAGFPDDYSMRLELQELDQDRLFALLEELDQLTEPHWERYKTELDLSLAQRYGLKPDQLMPWHYQDPFFQEAPRQELDLDRYYAGKDPVQICTAFFAAIGMPVEKILENSDLYEKDKKNQHAFCQCIDRKLDIRVLCNLRDNEYWTGTLLHELGHAVYDQYIDQNLPFLLRTIAHINSTEASAMLFGRLSRDASFLQTYVGLTQEQASTVGKLAHQQTAASLLVFARWALVMVHFERAMYQQPTLDLNAHWWDCVERFQGLKRIPQRNQPDWAAKLHLACAPAYYQNYVLGELTASQLLHHIQAGLKADTKSFCHSPAVGDFLRSRFYHLGAQYPWEETLIHATGEALNPHYFALDLQ